MTTINVCIGSACHLKGSYNIISELQNLIEENDLGDQVEIKAVFCLGKCSDAVAVRVDDGEIESVNSDTVNDFFTTRILSMLR